MIYFKKININYKNEKIKNSKKTRDCVQSLKINFNIKTRNL